MSGDPLESQLGSYRPEELNCADSNTEHYEDQNHTKDDINRCLGNPSQLVAYRAFISSRYHRAG